MKDVTEYGYGFWLRFMMRFPVPLFDGKKDSWYFIARLTNKEDYSDKEMGDRLLAVFQGLSILKYFLFKVDISSSLMMKQLKILI